MNFNFHLSHSLLGLDINPSGIWLAQTRKYKREFVIEQAASVIFSKEIFIENKIKQWKTLTEILLSLLKSINLKTKATALHISSNLVKRQRLSLPLGMSPAEVLSEIHDQVERDLPGQSDALCIDFSSVKQNNTGYSDIYFAATNQSYLAQYVECIQEVGLKVKVVDVDIYALKRAYQYAVGSEIIGNKNTAILYEHQSSVTLLIYHQYDIVFAEQWFVHHAEDFSLQLENKLQTYFSSFHTFKIQQIIIGGSNNEHCFKAKLFAEALSLPVFCPDAKKFLLSENVDKNFFDSQFYDFMVALGLSMREISKW